MSVALDAQGTEQGVLGSTQVLDGSLTVGTGDNRALVVLVAFSGAAPGTISVIWDIGSLTDPQPLTLIDTVTDSSANFAQTPVTLQLWGLIAPTSGNKILRITAANACDIFEVTVAFTGVSQVGGTDSFANAAHPAGSSAMASVAITSTVSDMVVAQFVTNGSRFGAINNTELYNDTIGSGYNAANLASGDTSVTMSGTMQIPANWLAQGVSIKSALSPPANQSEWVNPRGPDIRRQDWIYPFKMPSLAPAVPTQKDWPNPRGHLYRAVGHLDSFKLPLQGTLSLNQEDWPNPPRAARPVVVDWIAGSTWLLTIPPPPLPASRQLDWPNPRGTLKPVSDWSQRSCLIPAPVLSITARQTAWPNPTLRRLSLPDWVVGSTRLLTAPPPVVPAGRMRDWPVPRGPRSSIRLGEATSVITYIIRPPSGPREMLDNKTGRARFLQNEVVRIRWLARNPKIS